MYLTGGATAVLEGWRESTIDVDVRFEPDSDAALARIRDLKEELSLNVELASPLDFLPPLDGWQERSRFRFRKGNLEVFDFDPYSQALSKLERGDDRAGDVSLPGSRSNPPAKRGRVPRGRQLTPLPIIDSPSITHDRCRFWQRRPLRQRSSPLRYRVGHGVHPGSEQADERCRGRGGPVAPTARGRKASPEREPG
jgi:hypothetical protein